MKTEDFIELEQKHESEYGCFDRVDFKCHEDKQLCAMLKIYALMKDKQEFSMCPSHDVLYLPEPEELEMTEEDVLYLVLCGVHYDHDGCCLAIFM